MSEDKDRANNESNLYPSDYIDFTPSLNKSNSKLKAFILLIAFFFLALLSIIYIYPRLSVSQKSELPISIEKVQKKSQDIIGELKNLSQVKTFQIKELRKLIDLDLDLENSINDLRNIKQTIDREKDTKMEKQELLEIIGIDLALEKSMNDLRTIKVNLLEKPKK